MFKKKRKVTSFLAVVLAIMLVAYNIPAGLVMDVFAAASGDQTPVTEQPSTPAAGQTSTSTEATTAPATTTPDTTPAPIKHTVTVNQTGSGTVKINETNYTKPVEVEEGNPVTVDAIPSSNYKIKSVTIGTEEKTISDPKHFTETIPSISADTTIKVTFVEIKTVTVNQSGSGNVKVNGSDYTSPVQVEINSKVNLEITPDANSVIKSVKIGGNPQTISNPESFSGSIANISADTAVDVVYALKTYKITFTALGDGTIKDQDGNTIASTAGTIDVEHGSNASFTAIPNTGFHVKSIEVDKSPLDLTTDVTRDNDNVKYEFNNVTASHTVTVTFAINTYQVSASVPGGNGTVKLDKSTVNYDGTVNVTMTPVDNSYKADYLTVNGTKIGNLDTNNNFKENEDGSFTYTLTNIKKVTTIEAAFAKSPILDGSWEQYATITADTGSLLKSYTKDNNQIFVFSKDANVKVAPKDENNRIDLMTSDSFEGWKDSFSITNSSEIKRLLINPKNQKNKRGEVLLNNHLLVLFDTEKPKVNKPEVTGDNEGQNGDSNWYSGKIKVKGTINNVEQTFNGVTYSTDIVKVYYSKGDYSPQNAQEASFDSKTNSYSFVPKDEDTRGIYSIWAVDKAGNISDIQTADINIDKMVPTLANGKSGVTFETVNDGMFAKIIHFLTFGTFFSKKVQVTVKAEDIGSGIQDISLRTSDRDVTPAAIEGSFYSNGIIGEKKYELDVAKFKGSFDVDLTDRVGNKESYHVTKDNSNIVADTDVVVMEKNSSDPATITVTPNEGVTSYEDKFFSGNVTYHVNAQDSESGVNAVKFAVNGEDYQTYDFSGAMKNNVDISINTDDSKIKLLSDRTNTASAQVVDNAGNMNEVPNSIYIDKTAPALADGKTGVTFETKNDGVLAKLINILSFGTFFSKQIEVTVKAQDEASGMKNITLSTSDSNVKPEKVEGSFKTNGLTAEEKFTLAADRFKGTFHVGLTDNVNNTASIKVTKDNSNIEADNNGDVTIENTPSNIDITASPLQEGVTSYEDTYFSGDAGFNVKVGDPDSGVNTVVTDLNGQKNEYHYDDAAIKQVGPLSYTANTNDQGITMNNDNSYVNTITVIDNAGNVKTDSKTIYKDQTVPTLAADKSAVTFEEKNDGVVAKVLHFLTFGTYFNKETEVTVKAQDDCSGIKDIALKAYPLKNSDKAIDAELVPGSFKKVGKNGEAKFILNVDSFEGTFAAELTDNVNNKQTYEVASANSNIKSETNRAVMIEKNKPSVKLGVASNNKEAVNPYVDGKKNKTFYRSDVTYSLDVQDDESGIYSVVIDINGKEYKKYEYFNETQKQTHPKIDSINTAALANSGIKLNKDGSYNISVTALDNAGNETVENNTLYIDTKAPELDGGKSAVTFDVKNDNYFANALNFLTFGTFFNKKIEVTVKVKETDEYGSGIKDFTLNTSDKDVKPELVSKQIDGLTGEAKYTLDVPSFTGTFNVETEDNVGNKSLPAYLVNDGNSNIEAKDNGIVMIEKTRPEAKLEIQPYNSKKEEAKSNGDNQYSGDVTFGVNASDADSGINTVKIDINGQLYKEYDFSGGKQTNPELAVIPTDQLVNKINKDGSYVVSLYVIDNAGNINSDEKTIYIDRTNPKITNLSFSTEDSNEDATGSLKNMVELTEYGYYFKKPTQVKVFADDPQVDYEYTSKVKSITAYLKDYENGKYYAVLENGSLKEITEADIGNIAPIATAGDITFTVPEAFKGQIFAKATDHVENTGAFETPDGTIKENAAKHSEESHISMKKEDTSFKDNQNLDLYAKNVPVHLKVADTYSGLREIEWSVTAPYDQAGNQHGVIRINNDGSFASGSNADGWTVAKTEKNLIEEMTKTLTVSNNSNAITVKVKMTDRAGNTSEDQMTFSIDKTTPVVNVTYDNNTPDKDFHDIYKSDRTATIVVTERNFKPEDFEHVITNTDGVIPKLLGWSTAVNTADPDKTTHTATVHYTSDGDYTFDLKYKDNAGNAAAPFAQQKFTLDKTIPVIKVSYDNNSAAQGNYFKAGRTATISINEHNFDPGRIQVHGTAADNGSPAAFPGLSGWSRNGDVNTATIHYAADAKYSFDIDFTDKAGNAAADFKPEEFYVDQTAPELAITGVQDKSANNGDVIPVVTYSDTNLNQNTVSIKLSGANRGPVKLDGAYSDVPNGKVFTFKNFEKDKKVDDIYTLTAALTDNAGNETTKTIQFSVNRFGSVYVFDDALKKIEGKYVKHPVDVIVTETNVDVLKTSSLKMTKNGTPTDLKEGKDYTVTHSGGNGKWSQYKYVINKKLFAGDGRYTVALYSKDAAGNINENIDEKKQAEISFGVDKTAPVIIPIDFESGKQYPVDSKPVTISIKDNLVLDRVKIYLNDKKVAYKSDGENYTFTIPNANFKQNVRIVAVDAAGNKLTKEVNDFLVSKNLFVRWYNNTLLFIGTLVAAGVVAAGVTAAVRRSHLKRKKAAAEE